MRWIADRAVAAVATWRSHGGRRRLAAPVARDRPRALDGAASRRSRTPGSRPSSRSRRRPRRSSCRWRGRATRCSRRRLPFGVVPGNHDYDAMWSDSRYPPVKDARKIDMTPKTLGMLHIGGLDNFRAVFGATALLRGQALVRRELHGRHEQRPDVHGRRLHLPAHRARDVARRRGAQVGGVGDREAPGCSDDRHAPTTT